MHASEAISDAVAPQSSPSRTAGEIDVTFLRLPAVGARSALSVRSTFILVIAVAAMLPLALAGLVAARLVSSAQDVSEKQLSRGARHMSLDVDREIIDVAAILYALVGDELQRGDIEAFYRKSAEIGRRSGFDIVLRHGPRNQQVLNTAVPWGTGLTQGLPFPLGGEADDALRGGKMVVSDVFVEPRVKHNMVAVGVPIGEAGVADYQLFAVLPLDRFFEIMPTPAPGDIWIATFIDRKGTTIARSKDRDKFVGRPAAARPSWDGTTNFRIASGVNNDGTPFVWADRRSDLTGWVVSVGAPQAVFDEPRNIAVVGLLVIAVVAVLIAVATVYRASGPLARAMRQLNDAVVTIRQDRQHPRQAPHSGSFVEMSNILSAASEELRIAADQRRFMLSAAEVGIWQWDMDSGAAHWSARFREIIGVDDDTEASLEGFLARVNPDDRPAVADAMMRHISEGADFDREYRIVRADTGEVRWVHAKARIEHDRRGRPVRVLGVGMDVTLQKQSEGERDDLRRRLMYAQEDERQRLARELHDESGQLLAAAMLELKRLEPTAGARGAELLRRLRSQLDQMDASLRRIASELRPTSIDDLGVAKALADHIAAWSERFGIEVDYHCLNVDLDALPADIGTVVFRICQEALTNVAKHAAGTTDIGITVDRSDRMLRLTIEDNGCGFDPVATAGRPNTRNGGGLGIAGMRERLALIGGALVIESSIGVGTTIFVRIALETTKGAVASLAKAGAIAVG
jgi:two-component system, NarL family, sensor histidine kinase UhpB